MAIEVMTRVWKASPTSGAKLLMMLALADRADEDGVCWPGIQYLAERARCTDRHTKRMVQEVEAAGEIYVQRGGGRKNTNLYLIAVGLSQDQIAKILVRRFEMEVDAAIEAAAAVIALQKGDSRVTDLNEKGDIGSTNSDPDVTVSEEENGDIHARNGDIQDTNGDICDMETVTPESPDSSINPSVNPSINPPEGASADPPLNSRKQSNSKSDPRLDHPAIRAYRSNASRTAPKVWRDDIIQRVGDRPADVDAWAQLVKSWVGRGWNPGNIEGMLEAFSSGGLGNRKGAVPIQPHPKQDAWTPEEWARFRQKQGAP